MVPNQRTHTHGAKSPLKAFTRLRANRVCEVMANPHT